MTARRPKFSDQRDALTVADTKLIAAELRAQAKDTLKCKPWCLIEGQHHLDRIARILDQTADAMEKWALKVAMRRGDPVPPEPTIEQGPPLPPDPAWQSTRPTKEGDHARTDPDRNPAHRDR